MGATRFAHVATRLAPVGAGFGRPSHPCRASRRPSLPRTGRRRNAGVAPGPIGGLCAIALATTLGCGPGTVEERLEVYRAEVEAIVVAASPRPVSVPAARVEVGALAFPHRRSRRLDAPDERIGPFDFLATIGCPLSELAAERNGPLGRVLVPARRWDYERRVLAAIDGCAPTLGAERRATLEDIARRKRSALWVHTWNALWSSTEVERYLSSGAAAMIGGRDDADGPEQLRRLARAIERGDLEALESAQQALRDDPAAGPRLAAAARALALLDRVAALVRSRSDSDCDREARRLSAVFEHRFVPLRAALAEQAGFARELVEAVDALFAVSPDAGVTAPEMRAYRRALLGDGEETPRFDVAYRAAMVDHARAWAPVLSACGGLPGA